MPMTSLTCTSRHARTQRPHWMQASRLTRIAGWLASACQRALALDLHHAGAAIAVGPIVRRRRIAQMRNLLALAFRHLPDGFARLGLDLLAVELELNPGHSAASLNSSGKYLITVVSGFEAAWPSPQIEASRIAWLNSSSSYR